ncbi:MAG TPA: four helix bundle protein [Vicinamibacterales bacterium]|nr:four helix bundle protein [Vicinamibacterales bacterium]
MIGRRLAAGSGLFGGGTLHAPASGMTPEQMRARTDQFSVDIINFCRSLPPDPFTRKIAPQLHDAGTSVASNYHAACRAQSRAQFIEKLSISLEEADECVGWLHKLSVTGQAQGTTLTALQQEASELVAILAASRKTAERRRRPNDPNRQ